MTLRPRTHTSRAQIDRKHVSVEQREKTNEQARERQAKRTYSTGDRRWRRNRFTKLKQEPLCRECHKQGIIKAANVVDHIDEDPTNNAWDNLQSLCTTHHNRKTARNRVKNNEKSPDV